MLETGDGNLKICSWSLKNHSSAVVKPSRLSRDCLRPQQPRPTQNRRCFSSNSKTNKTTAAVCHAKITRRRLGNHVFHLALCGDSGSDENVLRCAMPFNRIPPLDLLGSASLMLCNLSFLLQLLQHLQRGATCRHAAVGHRLSSEVGKNNRTCLL
jgi:hypothetical protein